MLAGCGKRGFDVLGGVAQILGNHRALTHLVEQLAQAVGNTKGCAGLARAGRTVEVEDAAPVLRLDGAQVSDAVQIGTDLQRSKPR